MHEGKTVIRCSHVRRSYLDGLRVIEVLKDVNFDVSRGEIVSIVGPSGSGKTTLLNIIACLDKPTSGEVFIEDIAVNRLDDDRLSEIRRHKIGMVFQDFYLLPALSTLENVEAPMIFNNMPEERRKERAAELLALVELSNYAHHTPWELSSGEKQRAQIARALANDPPIILADEPTGNLDTTVGGKIVELLKNLAEDRDKTVLMATHDPGAASQTHRVLLLRDGVVQQRFKEAPEAL